MGDALTLVEDRPWAIPERPWVMTQRWHSLLFAHWPVAAEALVPLLPPGLVVDGFANTGWVGIVPFTMDKIRFRGLGSVPGARRFAELNLRTYVRNERTGTPGVYFFSLDAANPAAVMAARLWFHLPYFWAKMRVQERPGGWVRYESTRLLAQQPVHFRATYRGLGPQSAGRMARDTIEYFLTERYCLFTHDGNGQLLQGDIHHAPWPLEAAEAEIELNELPMAHGIRLPDIPPVLHFAREQAVYIWRLQPVLALA
ncbi:MAG: YqjF family protein [Acidobacteriaceae bacterium]